jgi:hypothetical protein
MSSPFVPFNAEGVSIVPRMDDGTLRIKVAGAIEMRDPGEVLNPYWNALDDEALRHHIQRVEVDLRDLSFMNSSGILTLVRWITRAKGHPAGAGYTLVLKYDRNVTWQRTSVPTLAKLAPGIVVATEIDG